MLPDMLSRLLKDIWEDAIASFIDDYSPYIGYSAHWIRPRYSSPVEWLRREREINDIAVKPNRGLCVCGAVGGEVHRPRCPIWMGHDSGYSLKKERCENCDGYFVALRNNLCWVCQYHVDAMVKWLSDYGKKNVR